jgi:hypothetical protein
MSSDKNQCKIINIWFLLIIKNSQLNNNTKVNSTCEVKNTIVQATFKDINMQRRSILDTNTNMIMTTITFNTSLNDDICTKYKYK